MEYNLRGKRLLFLGAVGGMTYAVKLARKMGITTVVADYYTDSQAKEYADIIYNISTTDLDAVSEIIEKEKIDGIFTGFSDVNLRCACELCKKHGFPCYVTAEQIQYTQDKNLFKDLCRSFDVPVPVSYSESEKETIRYPVIIKPSDAYAAKGISVCNDESQLEHAIDYAKSFSRNGKVTIEEYITGNEVMIHYEMINGHFRITSAYDRVIFDEFSSAGKSMAPLFIYNRNDIADLTLKYEEKLGKMYRSIGFSNAVGFLQGKLDISGVKFFEMALRFGGNVSEIFNSYYNNTDIIRNYIIFALTGKMPENIDSVSPVWNGFACNLTLFMNSGEISEIFVENDLPDDGKILDIQRYCSIGSQITEAMKGTYGAIAFRILLACTSKEEFLNEVDVIQRKVKVLDNNGQDMIDWQRINAMQEKIQPDNLLYTD